jgi:hypothetical protein
MDEGLSKCKYFFFFISQKSLESGMVNLEWTNALYKSVKDGIKFIPIKIDNSSQPTILLTTVYIDMYEIGMKETVEKIIGTIEDKDTSVYKATFDNVYCEVEKVSDSEYNIILKAKKFAEHNIDIIAAFDNEIKKIGGSISQFNFKLNTVDYGGSRLTGVGIKMINGQNACRVSQIAYTLSPENPLRFKLRSLETRGNNSYGTGTEVIKNLAIYFMTGTQGRLLWKA